MAQSLIRVFISYADADMASLEQLKVSLTLLERRGDIRVWDESRLKAGEDKDDTIARRLESARLFIGLLSVEYLASEKCLREVELARQRGSDECRTLLVLARPCNWRLAFSGDIEILPNEERAITTWRNRDEAWLQVLHGVQKSVLYLGTAGRSGAVAPKAEPQQHKGKVSARGRTLLPHETRAILQDRSDATEPPDTLSSLKPPITDLVGQRVGSIFVTNQSALRQLRSASRLAVEAEHEGSEERARDKRRLATAELLASIELTLLWRFDRMRIASPIRDSSPPKATIEGRGEVTNWLFKDCVRTNQDPSLELIGVWMHGSSCLTPGELLVSVKAALGIPPGLEHDVHIAGKLQHVLDNWSQWRRKHLDLTDLIAHCEHIIGIFVSGNNVEIDVPESTIT